MSNLNSESIPSTAAIAGHPIHPMLVPFPIAYLVGALATDLAYIATKDPFWATASMWLVGAGLVMGMLAGIAGFIDFASKRQIREIPAAKAHSVGNTVVLALAFVSLLLRIGDVEDAIMPWGLILSLITVGILSFTGWLGGELSYRHKIGVLGSERRNVKAPSSGTERRRGPSDRRAYA